VFFISFLNLWKNIDIIQIGFRKNCSTHYNISKVKQWIKSTSKGIALFVDISQAYDRVNRSYDILSSIGIPCDLILLYKSMTPSMRIYLDNNTEYKQRIPH